MIAERFCWTQFPEISGKDVQCFAEDSSGNFWFGIGSEIVRYDGLYWTYFSQKHGLPNSYPIEIVSQQNGRILALFAEEGLYSVTDTLWAPVFEFKSDSLLFSDILPVGANRYWLGSNRAAFFYDTETLYVFTADSNHFTIQAPHPQQTVKLNSRLNIVSLYEDRVGSLWLVNSLSKDDIFIRITEWEINLNKSEKWQTFSSRSRGIHFGGKPGIFQSSDGLFWIYTYTELTGLYRFSDPASDWVHIDLAVMGWDNLVISMLETRDKVVWLGGNGYLYAYQNDKFSVYGQAELKLPISPIMLHQANDGALWLLSKNIDVNRIDYGRRHWNVLENLHFHCSGPDGESYFISTDGKVICRTANKWEVFDHRQRLMDTPTVLLCTQSGEIWAAGSNNGIAAVSKLNSNGLWSTDLFPELSYSVSYQAALETQDGSLWFGSMSDASAQYRGGIIIYPNKTSDHSVRHFAAKQESFNRVPVLTQTKDGKVWAAGTQVTSTDGQKWKLINGPKELQQTWVDFVLGTRDSSLWIAKGGVGIFRLKNNQWSRFDSGSNLASIMVTNLIELKNGHLLAATSQGFSRFDGNGWQKYALPSQIRMLRESGTLRLDEKDNLWINLAPREWYFRALSPNKKVNQKIRTIRYQGDTLSPDTKITIYQNQLTESGNQYIAWHGFDHWGATSQEELSFSYRLDSDPWSEYTSKRDVQLLNLSGGNHQFEVRALDRDGNVDSTPAIVQFQVILPFWKQTWFWIWVSLFIITVAALMVRLGIQNQKLSVANREIEEIATFRERFFLNLSHEVRTPLTLILGPISELLAKKKWDRTQLEARLATMSHHAHYLLRLVNQMLDFRKLELGKTQLFVMEHDINQTLKSIYNRFQIFAEEHNITFILDSSGEPISAFFDSEKLETIMMNLLGNAFKFTPDGGNIRIKCKLADDIEHNTYQGRWMIIEVSDSGIGIPEDRLPHIFDRFYHVQHPGQLYYDSIGIGLDLTREIVEMHRGSIEAESELGSGSVFKVKIPIDKSAYSSEEIDIKAPFTGTHNHLNERLEEIREERKRIHKTENHFENQDDPDAKSGNLPKLLIVEDHADMRDFLGRCFIENYQIIQAENGRSGYDAAVGHIPDLIISDVMMPEMDGIEFSKRLKENWLTSHIPLVLLTVKGEIEHRIEGFETGADAYIAKPFNMDELKTRVGSLIETRERLRTRFREELDVVSSEITSNRTDTEFMNKSIKAIESNMGKQDFSVDHLCREIGMSRTQAYRKIKSITGFGLNEFIFQIRLKHAARMLLSSDLNISEIAYELGFCDHAHLSRLFKKSFGTSPRFFRQKAAEQSKNTPSGTHKQQI